MSATKRHAQWLDLSNPYVCRIFTNRVGREAFLFDQDEPPAPGGGATTEPPKTFTQADIDAAAAKIRNDERKKFADFDKFKEAATKLPDLEAKLTELQTQLEESKLSAEEKQRAAAARAAKTIETERAQLQTEKKAAEDRAIAAERRYLDSKITESLSTAFDNASVLTAAKVDAIKLMKLEAKIEQDEDGKATSVELNGVAYTSLDDAAVAFLKSKPHLVSAGHPPGGGGTKQPNGGGNGPRLKDMTAEQAFKHARESGTQR